MKILLAEDDQVTRRKIETTLKEAGDEIVLAADGWEADRMLTEDQSIRLVISDWVMPGIDGSELCRRLRQRADPFYTYFILITACSSLDTRLEGYQAGVDDFLNKPLHLDELIARVGIARRILEMQSELVRRSASLEALRGELERSNAQLADMAITDALTGLRNRRHFHRLFESSFVLAAESGRSLTVILLDVDQFKSYNDTYGHLSGDEVLVAVADVLRQNLRNHDLIARYGGEEFVVLVPDAGMIEGVTLADRLRRCLANHPWPLAPITASFGVSTISPSSPTPSRLIDQADLALYHSKKSGRNRVTHFWNLEAGHTRESTGGNSPSPPIISVPGLTTRTG